MWFELRDLSECEVPVMYGIETKKSESGDRWCAIEGVLVGYCSQIWDGTI